MLVWNLDTISQLLRVLPKRQAKVHTALEATPPQAAHSTLLRKWRKLLGLLWSITSAVAGSWVIFARVQHSLTKTVGRHVHLTVYVHYELDMWHDLVSSLTSSPTNL